MNVDEMDYLPPPPIPRADGSHGNKDVSKQGSPSGSCVEMSLG